MEKNKTYIRFEVKDDKGKNMGGLFRGLNKLLKDLWEDDNYLYDELNEPLSELEYLTIYPDGITDSKTKFAYTQDFYYEHEELFKDIEYVLNELDWELIMITLDRPNNVVYEDENQIAYI